jgi:hypothetical protein
VSRPVRWRRERRLALGLLVVAGLLPGFALQGAHGAKPGEGANELRQEQTGLSARTHEALLALYALNSRLSAARDELERLRGRVEALNR